MSSLIRIGNDSSGLLLKEYPSLDAGVLPALTYDVLTGEVKYRTITGGGGGSYNFANGLTTLADGSMGLGGTLINTNTSITAPDLENLFIIGQFSNAPYYGIGISCSSANDMCYTAILGSNMNGSKTSTINVQNNSIQIYVTDDPNSAQAFFDINGFRYVDNYYPLNTTNPRWIPDKAYVDSRIDASSLYLKEASLGIKFYFNSGLLDVSILLSNLKDVSITSVANDDTVIYDSSTSKWKNAQSLWTINSSTIVPLNPSNSVQFSSIQMEQNGGVMTLVDMPITSNASSGTEESYGFNIDGSLIFKVVGTADGSGSINKKYIVAKIDYFYMGDPSTDGTWRWLIDASGDLAFQKRVSSNWTSGGKFSI